MSGRKAKSSLWVNHRKTEELLISDGWRTPDTYCNKSFMPVEGIPAVYLFEVVNTETYTTGFVAYVGMSKNLHQRFSSHEILRELYDLDHWVCRWFKPTEEPDLRQIESHYIKKFDPPWNIVGRVRGVSLQ